MSSQILKSIYFLVSMLAKIGPNFENPKVTGKNFDVHLGKND